VLKFVGEQKIDLIMPLSDLDLGILARSKGQFERLGARIVVSDPQTIERCMNKRAAYNFCISKGIPTPDSFFSIAEFDGQYPAFRKLIRGSGSVDQRIVESENDIGDFVPDLQFLQRLMVGEEFGLDILNDFEGRFICVTVKKKLAMRAGETDRAAIVHHDKLERLGREISERFGHIGNLDVDVIEDKDGKLFCLDFNPRFGGGYPATHLAGMNYLQAIVNMAAGEPIELPRVPRKITVMKGISLHVMEGTA